MHENLVYDAHMNLVPDLKDVDDITGMSYVDQARPVEVMKTETVPNDFKDNLVDSKVFEVAGGQEISPDTNPMMVNTIVEGNHGHVHGSNNQFHTLEINEEREMLPVTSVLDPEDTASLEAMVSRFRATLEQAGYEVDFRGETDPNAPVDLTTLLDEVEYADGLSLRAQHRVETINDMREEIIGLGGVTRDQAYAIEQLRPQYLSARCSLESFTKFPTRTNYEATVVALEDLIEAAAVAGVVVTVLAIANLFKWLINTIQSLRYDTKSDTTRGRYLRGHETLMREIRSTDTRFRDVLSRSTPFQNIVAEYARKLDVVPTQDSFRTAIALDDAMYHRLTDGRFTEFVAGMYTGESTKLSQYLVTAVNNSLVSLEAKFNKLKAIADNDAIVPLDTFVSRWDEVADLANYLIGGISGSPDETIGRLSQAISHLHKRGGNSTMRYDVALTTIKYSLDKNFRFDRRNDKKIVNMFNTIKRIESKMQHIQDPEVRKNRADLYNIFKKEVQMLAVLVSGVAQCDNEAMGYIGLTNQVTSRNARMWMEAFKAGNVNFQWKGF